MERLASCYNDKMVLNPYTSLLNWRKEIIKRANLIRGKQNFTIGQFPSFDDFLIAVVIPMGQQISIGQQSNYIGEIIWLYINTVCLNWIYYKVSLILKIFGIIHNKRSKIVLQNCVTTYLSLDVQTFFLQVR